MTLKKKMEELETLLLKMQKKIDEHELKISHLEEKNILLKELLLAKNVHEKEFFQTNEPEKVRKESKKLNENNVTSIQRMRTIA